MEYDLSAIEYNLSVETGHSVGLVAKGNASVSIIFARKPDAVTAADDAKSALTSRVREAKQTSARYAHLGRQSVKVAAVRISNSLEADMDTPPDVSAPP